jgi:hypothetical protein
VTDRRRKSWGRAAAGLMVVVSLLSCDSATENSMPEELPEAELEFVPRRVTAPPLETMDTSFWAVKGRDSEIQIRYQGQGEPGTGKEFLDFVVEEQSLLRHPDGSVIADGDSIQIRITVDPELFLVSFEPSGLEFNPDEPAKLELDYDEAEDDYLAREADIDFWRQEQAGEPWARIQSIQIEELDEIEILITGFTRYALAIGR